MARIRNISGVDLSLPTMHGLTVPAGGTVSVRDEDVYGFTCQESTWEPADKAAKAAHAAATTTTTSDDGEG